MALISLGACSSTPEERPETPTERRTRCEKALVASGDKDPWAFYELGALDEADGELARATFEYGSAVALLPPRKFTGPALGLGRVHLKLGHWDAARRMFDEVLGTAPLEVQLYRSNADYREAALGLREIFAHQPDPRSEERVRQRYLDELGGTERDWPGQ